MFATTKALSAMRGPFLLSVLVRGIDAIQAAQQSRPNQLVWTLVVGDHARLFHRGIDDALLNRDEFAAAGLRANLNGAGGFEGIHQLERLGDGAAHGEQAVIT